MELNGPLPARVPSRSVARNGRARHGTGGQAHAAHAAAHPLRAHGPVSPPATAALFFTSLGLALPSPARPLPIPPGHHHSLGLSVPASPLRPRAAASPRPLLRSGWRPPSPARRPSAARARPGPRLQPRRPRSRQLEPPRCVPRGSVLLPRRFFGAVVLQRFRFGSRGKERFLGRSSC